MCYFNVCRTFKQLLATDKSIMSADMAVDPGSELDDPGVDPWQVWSAAA